MTPRPVGLVFIQFNGFYLGSKSKHKLDVGLIKSFSPGKRLFKIFDRNCGYKLVIDYIDPHTNYNPVPILNFHYGPNYGIAIMPQYIETREIELRYKNEKELEDDIRRLEEDMKRLDDLPIRLKSLLDEKQSIEPPK